MGWKALFFLIAVIVLVSACSTDKTRPVVTDITGGVVGVVQGEGNISEEEAEGNETIPEDAEETEVNESEEESEEELPPGAHVIIIKELKLDPRELTIKKGETVVWKHEDEWEDDESTRHYLAAHTNEFRTPILYYGDTFEHTFNETGTFTYIDIIYKERDYMRGEIVVE